MEVYLLRSYFPLRQTVNWDLFKQPDQINTSARTRVRFERRDGRLERMARRLRLEKVGVKIASGVVRNVAMIDGSSPSAFLYGTINTTSFATLKENKGGSEVMEIKWDELPVAEFMRSYEAIVVRDDGKMVLFFGANVLKVMILSKDLKKSCPPSPDYKVKTINLPDTPDHKTKPIIRGDILYFLTQAKTIVWYDSKKFENDSDGTNGFDFMLTSRFTIDQNSVLDFGIFKKDIICLLPENQIKNLTTKHKKELSHLTKNDNPWQMKEEIVKILCYHPSNTLIVVSANDKYKSTLHLLDPSTFSLISSTSFYGSTSSFFSIFSSGSFKPAKIGGKPYSLLWIANNNCNVCVFLIGREKMHLISPGTLFVCSSGLLSAHPIPNSLSALVFTKLYAESYHIRIALK